MLALKEDVNVFVLNMPIGIKMENYYTKVFKT